MIVPRMTAGKGSELGSFWRAHLDGWRRSDLNQREYCELHGLPLKRFGNWRAKLKHEEPTSAGKLLYRRGGGLSHMTKGAVPAPTSHIPSARSTPPGKRRRFSEADKRRIVEAADRPGASVSDVARRHGIAVRQLFRWKQERAPAAKTETTFLPVTITDAPEQSPEASQSLPGPAPVIVERSAPGIEVELIGGRRVRFERDVDPETVRRLVTLLEGEAR
ncbi:MAG: transposase [Proteobacteria bacterium]|nr:transposase [Pseudomonadota bacterium]